jgi:ATP-dependent DNA ligase
MLKAFGFCLPTAAKAVPAGPDWIHEIKYDGYRLRVERQGKIVRLITKNGHDRHSAIRRRCTHGPRGPSLEATQPAL